jgi:transcriptional regulator with XRE-family HTH domain
MPTSFANRLEANVRRRRLRVGRLLAAARKAANFPQEAVAEALDYEQADISRIEHGKRTVDIVELENFAIIYGKSVEDFKTWRTQQYEDMAALKPERLAERLAEDEFVTRAAKAKLKGKWRWKNYRR